MKKRASIRRMGIKLSLAHREAISKGQLGNKRGSDTGDKIRARHFARIGTLQQRFWKLVDIKIDECWIWKGSCDLDGYGISIGKNPPEDRAHRLSYYYVYGPIEIGLFICHHCDNPSCVRPSHLFMGTARDNVQDCIKKGRKKKLCGPENPMFGRRKINGKWI